jgi:Outer membrane protein beta-barrel domain
MLMDEHLHNDLDQFYKDALQNQKHDLPDAVWNKIDAGLDKEDQMLSRLRRRQQFKNMTWVLLFLFTVIGITTFQFRKDRSTGNVQLSRQQPSADSGSSSLNKIRSNATVLNRSDDHLSVPGRNSMQFVLPNFSNKHDGNKIPSSEDQPLHTGNEKIHHSTVYLLPDSSFVMKTYRADVSLEEPFRSGHSLVENHSLPSGQAGDHLIVKHEKQRIKNRFSITPYYSKEIAGYDLTDNNDAYGQNGQEIEKKERNVFSASIGFYINYKISKRWVLQSGISFSKSKSNIDSSTSYAVKDNNGNVQYKVNTISGYGYLKPGTVVPPAIGDSVSTANTYSELHYLSVPLILSYRFPMKRFSLLLGAGIVANMLTGASIETKTYGSGNPEKEYAVNMMGLKKFNMGVVVKADLEYRINSRVGFNVIPSFKNSVSPVNPESALTAYPFNFGIGLGITYRF